MFYCKVKNKLFYVKHLSNKFLWCVSNNYPLSALLTNILLNYATSKICCMFFDTGIQFQILLFLILFELRCSTANAVLCYQIWNKNVPPVLMKLFFLANSSMLIYFFVFYEQQSLILQCFKSSPNISEATCTLVFVKLPWLESSKGILCYFVYAYTIFICLFYTE